MKIFKAGEALCGGQPSAEELELIRGFARGEVGAEDVYTFPVVLCDNDVDAFESFVNNVDELSEKYKVVCSQKNYNTHFLITHLLYNY